MVSESGDVASEEVKEEKSEHFCDRKVHKGAKVPNITGGSALDTTLWGGLRFLWSGRPRVTWSLTE